MGPSNFVSLDFATLPPQDRYKLLIGAIVPRPIAFVSTVNAQGVGNLAPFSFFTGVSSNPPCLVFAVTRKSDGGKKDTLRNIEATKSFVVNTVSEWMAEPMNQASGDYPYGVDEMSKVGLTALPSIKVKAPRVKEAAVQMECVLHQLVEIGDGQPGSSTLVIGQIVMMHVLNEAYDQGKIRIEALQPIARLAGTGYSRQGEIFHLERPKV